MYQNHHVAIVAAIGRNRELGYGNKLLWAIPDDLKRFRALTKGHPVVMGRKTFESIVAARGGPLPERTNIVITRDPERVRALVGTPENVVVAASLEEGLAAAMQAPGSDEIHIGGGAEIYALALPYVDTLYLTLVDASCDTADSFFPAFEDDFVPVPPEETRVWNNISYRWVTLRRRSC